MWPCSPLHPIQHGMSIGIGDTVADVATGAKIGAIIDAAKEDVQRIIEQYQVRVCDTQTGQEGHTRCGISVYVSEACQSPALACKCSLCS